MFLFRRFRLLFHIRRRWLNGVMHLCLHLSILVLNLLRMILYLRLYLRRRYIVKDLYLRLGVRHLRGLRLIQPGGRLGRRNLRRRRYARDHIQPLSLAAGRRRNHLRRRDWLRLPQLRRRLLVLSGLRIGHQKRLAVGRRNLEMKLRVLALELRRRLLALLNDVFPRLNDELRLTLRSGGLNLLVLYLVRLRYRRRRLIVRKVRRWKM